MLRTLAVLVAAAAVLASLGCAQRQAVSPTPPAGVAPAHPAVAPAAETALAVKPIGSADFDAEVLKSDIPVLVDFFATWCGPCKRLSPIIDQIATERAGKVKFVRVDVDESKDTATQYKIDAMPTLVVFDKGAEKVRWVGAMEKPELDAKLDEALKP